MKDSKLIVKNRVVGEGKPLVCVPVMGSTADEILASVKKFADRNSEMIEWRVDAFKDCGDLDRVKEVLKGIGEVIGDSILVFTYRSKEQGGLRADSRDYIEKLHVVAAESGICDFVDVEFFASDKPEKEIKILKELGTHIISSHHDFDKTPESGVIRMLLEKMYESGTDIVKLAVMPQDIEDVLLLLSETAHFHKTFPDKPLITMSMGACGSVSRVAGEYFGSCVTFGAGEVASAPGQLPQEKLEVILEELHESITR